jgi:hypothetical protein
MGANGICSCKDKQKEEDTSLVSIILIKIFLV